MSYIQNKEHLMRYINKIIRENLDVIEHDRLLSIEMYFELYSKKLLDKFTWSIKNDPTLLHEENYFNWLKDVTKQPEICSWETKKLTKDFLDKIEDLTGIPGVYLFFNENDTCLYVGVSVELGSRIITSFNERFRNYNKTVYLRYFITLSRTDAAVLENVAISIYKPIFNVTNKYDDELTIDIKLPELSHKICCNKETSEKTND